MRPKRRQLLWTIGLNCLLATCLTAHSSLQAQGGKHGGKPMANHRLPASITPAEAFHHLRKAHAAALAAADKSSEKGKTKPQPRRRPSGAGRYVAAIIQSANLPVTPQQIFASRSQDFLLLSSPGPCVRTAEIAALEQAALQHRLSLAVILVDPTDPSLLPIGKDDSPSLRRLKQRSEAARALAAMGKYSVAQAHGLQVSEQIYRASALLRNLRDRGLFRLTVGVMQPAKGRQLLGKIKWNAKWNEPWPLQPLTTRPGKPRKPAAKPGH